MKTVQTNEGRVSIQLTMVVESNTPVNGKVEEFTIVSQAGVENELDLKINGEITTLPLNDSRFYVNKDGQLIVSTQFSFAKQSENEEAELEEIFASSQILPFTINDDDSNDTWAVTVISHQVEAIAGTIAGTMSLVVSKQVADKYDALAQFNEYNIKRVYLMVEEMDGSLHKIEVLDHSTDWEVAE